MRVEVMHVTPAIAAMLMAVNAGNRPVNKLTVKAYAADMAAGRWQANGCTIQIAATGRLVDGQHRLLAVIASGHTVPMLVVRGVDESVFATIDVGRGRTNAVIFGLAKLPYATLQAAIARAYIMTQNACRTGSLSFFPDTKAAVLAVASDNPSVGEFAAIIAKGKILNGIVGGVAVHAATKYGNAPVADFLSKCSAGEGLFAGDPAYELREKMRGGLKSYGGKTLHGNHVFGLSAKAISAHCQGKRIKRLAWATEQGFPAI